MRARRRHTPLRCPWLLPMIHTQPQVGAGKRTAPPMRELLQHRAPLRVHVQQGLPAPLPHHSPCPNSCGITVCVCVYVRARVYA